MEQNVLSQSQWDNFKAIQNKWHNSFGYDANGIGVLTWVRTSAVSIPVMGDDDDGKFNDTLQLPALFDYNVKRVWPLTKYTDTGEEDKQSEVAMLNKQYLRENNLLDADDNFAYNAATDKFIYKGITYYSAGDTYVSQLPQADDLFYYLVLRRSDFGT